MQDPMPRVLGCELMSCSPACNTNLVPAISFAQALLRGIIHRVSLGLRAH